MLRHTFIPDYTVRAVTEVFYVKVKRSLYLAAKRATLLERSQKDPLPSQEQFDDEVEKVETQIISYYKLLRNFSPLLNVITDDLVNLQLLHSLEEDDRSVPESPILLADRLMDNEKGKDAVIHSPIRSVTAPTSPLPVSASPITNSKFISPRYDGKIRNSSAKVSTYHS